jgi:hypothetical protein
MELIIFAKAFYNTHTFDWVIFTSLCTFLAALATLATVREMRQGRIQSLSPQIVLLPPDHKYAFRWIPQEDVSILIRPEAHPTIAIDKLTRLPVFKLKNIGIAAAQNITFRWHLSDQEEVFRLIDKADTLKEFSPQKSNEYISLTRNTPGGTTSWSVVLKSTETITIPYLTTSPTSDVTERLVIPDRILNNLCFRFISETRPIDWTEISGHNILVDVEYYDLASRRHIRRFSVESELFFMPDAVQSSTNSVEQKYHHPSNLRGTLKFRVLPITPS